MFTYPFIIFKHQHNFDGTYLGKMFFVCGPSEEAETLVDAAVTVNVMGEVAVIIPTISPNEGR